MAGGCRDDDPIERRLRFPAEVAVAVPHVDVLVAELLEPRAGRCGERLHDLDRKDPIDDLGQHRRLVPGARAYLENAVPGPDLEQLGHRGHDERLRNRLPVAYRQRLVLVGEPYQLLGNEPVPRHLAHGPQHILIADRVLGSERRIDDMLAYQPLSGLAEAVVRRFLCESLVRLERADGYEQKRQEEAAQRWDDGFSHGSCWALTLANHGKASGCAGPLDDLAWRTLKSYSQLDIR